MSNIFVVLLFVAVLVLPGLSIGVSAGLRRWTAVAASPVLSYGLIAITAQACALFGLDFGPLPVLAVTLAATGLLVAGQRWSGRRHSAAALGSANAEAEVEADASSSADGNETGTGSGSAGRWTATRRANDLWITAGIVVGTALGALTVLKGMGSFDAVTQGTDSIWHVNLVRFIIETGNASPTATAQVRGFDSYYYPNVYHSGVALVGMIANSSIMALTGAHLMLVAGIAGLGMAGLLRKFTHRTAIAASVPVVVAMFYLFPYYLMAWGPLWPFVTGIALIPGFLLLFSDALDGGPRSTATLLVTGMAAAGLLGVHTSAAVTAAIFMLFLVGSRWLRARAHRRPDILVVAGIALAAILAAPAYVSATIGVGRLVTEANVDWPVVGTPGVALGNLLFLNIAYLYPPYWLVGLMFLGVLGWRRLQPMAWWFAATVVFLALYVAAASYNSPLTEAITLIWWNDYLRLGGIVSLALILLATAGLVTLVDTAAAAVRRRIPAADRVPPRRVHAVVGLTVALGLGVLTSGLYVPINGSNLNAIYQDAPLISNDEQTAMYALADMVEPGAVVMNDPNDGSPWMWALVDVRPMYAHSVGDINNPSFTDDYSLLLHSFRCLDSDPDVREAIEANNITHVFLGEGFIGSNFHRVEGLRNVIGSDSLNLVYDENGIEIYAIDLAPIQAPNADCARQNS